MFRWIFTRIIGFILPNLISNFLKSEKKSEKINKINVQIKIIDKNLGDDIPLPKFNTEGSAALDLRTNIGESKTIEPNETYLFSTGFSIYIGNPDYAAFILPRSGLGHKNGIVLGNLIGLIDSDYQGEIMISLWNRSNNSFTINRGDRIAQMMFVEVASPIFKIVDKFEETERGTKGFGSSGKD